MPDLKTFLDFLRNGDGESILRSWAMKIARRLLSKENIFAAASSKLLS